MVNIIRKAKKNKNNTEDNHAAEKKPASATAGSYTEEALGNMLFSSSLAENNELVKQVFGANADLVMREITLGMSMVKPAVIYYIDNLIDSHHIDNDVMRPLIFDVYTAGLQTGDEIAKRLLAGSVITRAQQKLGKNMKDLMEGLLSGELGLFIEGVEGVLVVSVKGYDYRTITEPEVEPSVRGPKDSFVEVLNINIGLLRRRIKSPNLIIESVTLGAVTRTKVCIAYIRGVCKMEIVDEVRSRISRINVDGIFESAYIEEFMRDHPYSIFPQVRVTERPDSTAASLLEGRIAVMVDGSPALLIVPAELTFLAQAAEDYYNSFIFSSLIRLIRFVAITLATLLPALYISATNYHQELLPEHLIESVAASREGVPFPAVLEAFLMEFTFEILREAGVRLPKTVGPAVSIVGALVIGQSAVQANLVSPLMVIVVATTGIATFTIPQYNISLAVRIVKFALMILASIAGFYGVMIGLLFILLHLCSLRSFGVPYLSPFSPVQMSDYQDTVIRLPLWMHTRRPVNTARDLQRMPSGQMPKPPENGEDVP